MAQAIITTEQDKTQEPELGPTTDKQLSQAKISFSDASSMPKLLKIDDNRLNNQIKNIKKQNIKTYHNDKSKVKTQSAGIQSNKAKPVCSQLETKDESPVSG